MAAKRLREDTDGDRDSDQSSSDDKRMKGVPSISTVVREAVAMKSFQNFVVALEPVLRRVVNEEVERGLLQGARTLHRPPVMQIQQAVETPPLQLIFSKSLSLPVFTGSKIEDADKNPLRVLLVDGSSGSGSPVSFPSPVRVEIVALNGDFPGDLEDWTSEEFDRNVVKEREGKRPLVTGDVVLTLRDGSCTIGELSFTDNSSWIRSRNFRLGARVSPGSCTSGLRIKPAMTEAFVVKDHRGELYRKHYPPSLNDEVWRLEKIGKDGVFHQKLRAERIDTVEGFLRLSVVDEAHLRSVLGPSMSDRMWEGTIGHARTCAMGCKLYLYRSPRSVLLLNPICQVEGIVIDGQAYPTHNLNGAQRDFVQQLVLEAYRHWDQVEEVDEMSGRAVLQQQCNVQMPQIAMSPSSASLMYHPTDQQDNPDSMYQSGGFDLEAIHGSVQVEFSGWIPNPDYAASTIPQSSHLYNMPDSSSEDDEESKPSRGFSGAF